MSSAIKTNSNLQLVLFAVVNAIAADNCCVPVRSLSKGKNKNKRKLKAN